MTRLTKRRRYLRRWKQESRLMYFKAERIAEATPFDLQTVVSAINRTALNGNKMVRKPGHPAYFDKSLGNEMIRVRDEREKLPEWF